MLATSSLNFTHDSGVHLSFPSLKVEAGEAVAIVGASGSGKTSWLHILAGLLKPESGSCTLHGISYTDLQGQKLDRFRGSHIGFVFQEPTFVQALTVADNIRLAGAFTAKHWNNELVQQQAKEVGIDEQLDRMPATLSTGQKQRVALLRALIHEPALILADEPTSGLDDRNAEHVGHMLQQELEKKRSVLVIATHDPRLLRLFHHKYELV